MPSSVWQIADHLATLKDAALGGSLTPDEPAAGLWIDEVFGAPVPRAELFQVGTAATAAAEYFDRGADLVATYEEVGLRDLRIQVYWRIVDRSLIEPTTAAVDLILSVQTSRPEIDPKFSVSLADRFERVPAIARSGIGAIHGLRREPGWNLVFSGRGLRLLLVSRREPVQLRRDGSPGRFPEIRFDVFRQADWPIAVDALVLRSAFGERRYLALATARIVRPARS